MKSKKLFAILTLVAFLMTLVPMAVFADVDTSDRYASIIDVDKTEVAGDNDSFIKFTVTLLNGDNDPVANQKVEIASSRGATDTFWETDEETKLVTSDAGMVWTSLSSDSNGEIEFKMSSGVKGTAKVAIGLVGSTKTVYQYLDGATDATASAAKLIGTEEITFTAGGVDAVETYAVESKAGTDGVITPDASGDFDVLNAAIPVEANDADYYKITYKVVNAGGGGIADQKVTFSLNKTGARLSKTEDTTDATGKVDVKVYASKDGDYKVKAVSGGESRQMEVNFDAGDAFGIELDSDNNQKIALAQEDKYFDLKVTDIAGNELSFGAGDADGVITTVDVVTEPDDSDIVADGAIITEDADGVPQFFIPEFTEEGAYQVRLELDNGKATTIDFTVADQDTITNFTVEYDESTLQLGAESKAPTVTRFDAAGYGLEADLADTEFEFFSSDTETATVDLDGGVVYATDDKDYVGTVTITAVDKEEDLTATTTMNVANVAKSLIFDIPATTVPGETAEVTVKVVDKNGKVVALGDGNAPDKDAWITASPADSATAFEFDGDFDTDMQEKGTGILKVDSDKAGTVKLQVKVDDITASVSVTFAAAAPPKVIIGAKKVTMFIGATGFVQDGVAKVSDVAPFVTNGRTFVAVKPIAEAFGATPAWNEATKTVTLTRSDMTITIVIGSSAITVVKDGVTTTVTADVAAYIANGRTVLPFRAVAEAFGATVAYDAATGAVSFEQ